MALAEWEAALVVGIGLDIVDIREFQAEVDAKREEWLLRVFTEGERAYCQSHADPYRHLAGTFAAKEAALKALGTGWTDNSDLNDVEITRSEGRPVVVLRGRVQEMAGVQRVRTQLVSITHTKDYAAAIVVLES